MRKSHYPGDYSAPICTIGQVGEHQSKPKNNNLAVAVAVVSCIVIIGLIGALVFVILRHKRLQRSLKYTNSIYHSGSETTVIATDNNLGELFFKYKNQHSNKILTDVDDAPMIRGFSDDEPLVVA